MIFETIFATLSISILSAALSISGGVLFVPAYAFLLESQTRAPYYLSLVASTTAMATATAIYWKRNEIDFRLAKKFLAFALPFAAIGAFSSKFLDVKMLAIIFSAFTLFYAVFLAKRLFDRYEPEKTLEIRPIVPSLGGLMTGLLSFGVGAAVLPQCLDKHCKKHTNAVGTTCLVVLSTLVAASAVHLAAAPSLVLSAFPDARVFSVIIPSAAFGAFLGTKLVKHSHGKNEIQIAFIPVLVLVSVAMLLKVFA